MNLLFVAAGRLPIPPVGWGAVEKLVYEQTGFLTQHGLARVAVLNRRNPALWQLLRARPWRYDLVHLHDDSRTALWTRAASLLRFRLGVTTHDGYAAFPERWSTRFTARFDALRDATAFFALSPRIARVAKDRGFRNRVIVQPNGLFCEEMRFAPAATREALVLGKIDERKKQRFLAEALRGGAVRCDLIGPLGSGVPADFDGNGANVRRRGEWTREEVRTQLTEYACLVLLSDGEAHPLVVLEALAAGLSVVVSEEAAENLDTDLPFVQVVGRDDTAAIASAVVRATAENARYRAEIRRYCREKFDWNVLMPRYVAKVEQVVRGEDDSEAL